jgi:hypothetical protein
MLTWRDAVIEDLPSIERLWDEQEDRFAVDGLENGEPSFVFTRPQLFDDGGDQQSPFYPFKHPVIRVRVAERDGEIVAFRKVEVVCEVEVVGSDEEAIKSLAKELPQECHWARGFGYESGWGLAPKRMAKVLGRVLRNSPLRVWNDLRLVGCLFRELGD